MSLRYVVPIALSAVYVVVAFRLAHFRKRGVWFEWTLDFLDPNNYERAGRPWLIPFLVLPLAVVVAWVVALS